MADDRSTGYVPYRSSILNDLRQELLGPTSDDPEEVQNGTIPISPLQLYSTGILFPRERRMEDLEDSSDIPIEAEESQQDLAETIAMEGTKRATTNSSASDSHPEDQPLNLANEFSPAAMGISFRLAGPTSLSVRLSYGTYQTVTRQEPHPRAGQIQADGSAYPETRGVTVYQRTHHSVAMPLEIPETEVALDPKPVPGSEEKLSLRATVRLKIDGTLVISLMLVNENISRGGTSPDYRDAFYQVGFEVRANEDRPAFLPVDRAVGFNDDRELASLDLLYRFRRSFALGHGCAADWNRSEHLSESGATDLVCTSCLPSYELKPVVPREEAYGDKALNLEMRSLSDGLGTEDPTAEIISWLNDLADDYEIWIDAIDKDSHSLNGRLLEAADRHVSECRKCLERVREGIDVLAGDPVAILAFRLANKAMLMQQFHSSVLREERRLGSEFPEIPDDYKDLPDNPRKWRPFQLAFVLMNIAGASDPGHADRKIVDLIWFPTGGGKTEAYLGLAAFTICLERLRNSDHRGTLVVMRYTLRLLTAQQFQRASALILALDTLRREATYGADLGQHEISIGLWVGQSLSPNRRADARKRLRDMRRNSWAPNPFQVLNCPWCKVELANQDGFGYVEERVGSADERTVLLRCPDGNCRYSDGNLHMPIYVVDDDLYDRPPTLLLGTVDKFAQIAWEERTGRFFGGGEDTSSPVLIIQDELHLISGPLGTIVGLYETAIEKLCELGGTNPKVVASTATVRSASEQCKALYNRETYEFPAQGLRAGDSYFAFEDHSAPGRLYLGVLGTALKSHQSALVRVASSLLQSPCYSEEELAEHDSLETLANPYGTLVWYFNTFRELGHAVTLCTGDIPEYLKNIRRRWNLPQDKQRFIREAVELTSRRTADEIPEILKQLEVPWKMRPRDSSPVDILLATNMISVGVDVPRLGVMIMSGQPKGTSEYIQATSRVGRNYPGLVVTVYTQTKSRDRSHYESFVGYHQSLYRFVEPTSVTPFSPQARERGIRGILIALARLEHRLRKPSDISGLDKCAGDIANTILNRIESIDEEERDEALFEIEEWMDEWRALAPPLFGRMGGKVDNTTLAYPYGNNPDPKFQSKSWPVLTSMRNVDGTSRARVIHTYIQSEGSDSVTEDQNGG